MGLKCYPSPTIISALIPKDTDPTHILGQLVDFSSLSVQLFVQVALNLNQGFIARIWRRLASNAAIQPMTAPSKTNSRALRALKPCSTKLLS